MKTVSVMMSTYNGERYLAEQIESLLGQTGVVMSLLVRDDGSVDSTRQLLRRYEEQGVLRWYAGENLKPARSFLDLVYRAPVSDYYAFCDQDDVWRADKLQRAVEQLERLGEPEKPCLYCSNFQLADAVLRPLPDRGHRTATDFGAALVAGNCAGCTTVFNHALLTLLRRGRPDILLMHDDWAHKLCLAVGGRVIYDETKTLLYRQHGANADGGIHRFGERLRRVWRRIRSGDRTRSRQTGELVRLYGDLMPAENLRLARTLAESAGAGLGKRLRLLREPAIATPSKSTNRKYRIAVLLKYF